MLLFFRIRRFCHFVVNLRYFDLFIMIVICASSFALATEEPVNEDAFRNKILNYFDYVFTIVFTVEMILKVCQTQVYRISGYFFVDIYFAFYKITFNFPKIQRNRKCILQIIPDFKTWIIIFIFSPHSYTYKVVKTTEFYYSQTLLS